MANAGAPDSLERVEQAANPHDVYRTVLLIGKTGNGKSTLGNVIVRSHRCDPPKEIFTEGHYGESETTHAKELIAEIQGKRYRIVDTVRIGDTGMEEEEVLLKIARTCHYLRGGLNQILFVSSGRFTKEERDAFNLLTHVLFNDDVCRFVTMVRTKAPYFDDPAKCAEDVRRMKSSNQAARSIFENTAKILHVNNLKGDENPEWAEIRERCRLKLLARLEMCGDLYYPDDLRNMQDRVREHVEEEDRLRRRIEELEIQQRKREEAHQRQIDYLRERYDRLETSNTERVEELQRQHKQEREAMETCHRETMKAWQRLRDQDMANLREELQREIAQVRTSLQKKYDGLITGMENELATLKQEAEDRKKEVDRLPTQHQIQQLETERDAERKARIKRLNDQLAAAKRNAGKVGVWNAMKLFLSEAEDRKKEIDRLPTQHQIQQLETERDAERRQGSSD